MYLLPPNYSEIIFFVNILVTCKNVTTSTNSMHLCYWELEGNEFLMDQSKNSLHLQSFTKYLRLTLVFT